MLWVGRVFWTIAGGLGGCDVEKLPLLMVPGHSEDAAVRRVEAALAVSTRKSRT
jgi:hypothetical protein